MLCVLGTACRSKQVQAGLARLLGVSCSRLARAQLTVKQWNRNGTWAAMAMRTRRTQPGVVFARTVRAIMRVSGASNTVLRHARVCVYGQLLLDGRVTLSTLMLDTPLLISSVKPAGLFPVWAGVGMSAGMDALTLPAVA